MAYRKLDETVKYLKSKTITYIDIIEAISAAEAELEELPPDKSTIMDSEKYVSRRIVEMLAPEEDSWYVRFYKRCIGGGA